MALYMFTSCGWFFDDISGIESIQILMYALRAIELVRRSSPNDLENGLMNFLVTAESNDPSYKNGARIFEDVVKPSKITPSLGAAHYAMMSLVEGIKHEKNPFSLIALPVRRNLYEKDELKAALGEVKILETRTDKSVIKRYFVVCKKDQEFSCVIGNVSAPDYDLINDEMAKVFSESSESLITIFSMMAQDVQYFSPEDLIPDARLALVDGMAGSFYARIKRDMELNEEFFNDFINLLRLVKEQPPSFLHDIFRLILIYRFYGIFAGTTHDEEIDFKSLLDIPGLLQVNPQINSENGNSLLFKEIMAEPLMKKNAQEFLIKNLKSFAESKKSVKIQNAVNFLKITVSQGIELDLWDCQNIFYDICIWYRLAETDNPRTFSNLIELGSLLGFIMEEK
jgi:hypothetical protein